MMDYSVAFLLIKSSTCTYWKTSLFETLYFSTSLLNKIRVKSFQEIQYIKLLNKALLSLLLFPFFL